MQRMMKYREWLALAGLQVLVGAVLFHEFMNGTKFFAYTDIGGDSLTVFLPQLIHLADYVRSEGWPMWSFGFGLGAPFLYPADPFAWLSIAGGAERILESRIWVYLLKLLIGGFAFHAFLRRLPIDPRAALFAALAYTFCGYAVSNGQWDPMASEVATYPLLLWAFAHRLQGGRRFVLPAVVVFLIASSGFIVSLCVFALLCFVLTVLVAEARATHARLWLRRIAPPFLIGVLLAAPILLPNLLVLLDSPRVSGPQALIGQRLAEIFSINSGPMLLNEVAGLFHKDLLGAGNLYTGWTNYLEGPDFYVGTLALLLIPQLWQESGRSRRLLVVGGGFLALYFLFPAIRYLAYGFALSYFRVSSLWISMLLLVLAAFALDLVLRRAVDRRLLAQAAPLVVGLPLLVHLLQPVPSAKPLVVTLLAFAACGAAVLAAAAFGRLSQRRLGVLLILLLAAETTLVAYPSYHRTPGVMAQGGPPHSDLAQWFIKEFQRRDPSFYRIEKTFDTMSEADSLAQRYFGVKSYGFNSSSTVRFFTGAGIVAERRRGLNPSNWLPGFGRRFPLYSLVGVKYLLSRDAESWPGFEEAAAMDNVRVYRNDLALPLGVVHTRQIPEAAYRQSSGLVRDVAMLHGLVTETPIDGLPVLSLAALGAPPFDVTALYVEPAKRLRTSGMTLAEITPNRVRGEVNAPAGGVLALSIPYSAGWTASVDGDPVPTFRAQLGLTALRIAAGTHRVELKYFPPGLLPGLIIAFATLAALLVAARPPVFFRRLLRSSTPSA